MRFVSIIIILLGWIRRSFSLSVSDYSTQTTVFPLLCWLLRFIAIPVSMFVFPVALLQLFHSVSAFQACVCGVWSIGHRIRPNLRTFYLIRTGILYLLEIRRKSSEVWIISNIIIFFHVQQTRSDIECHTARVVHILHGYCYSAYIY